MSAGTTDAPDRRGTRSGGDGAAAPEAPRSPRELDQTVRTTTVRGWIALALAGLAVAAALVWAVVATVPRQTTATAVVADDDASRAVVAGHAGSVVVTVEPGDRVAAGDAVARIAPFAGGGAPRRIAAPVAGRVRDVLVVEGQGVERADTLLTLAPGGSRDGPRRLVTFLPESEAALYRPGAEVAVALEDPATGSDSTVPARVENVADTPSRLGAMEVALQSAGLADRLQDEADGAAYRVDLAIRDASGRGAVEGQVVEVTNTYDRPHPVELLFGDGG